MYQAGTLSGNPLATAAGLATLRLLDADAYARLAATNERLAEGSPPSTSASGRLAPGLVTPFFRAEPAARLRRRQRSATSRRTRRFARGLLDRGIYPPASQFEAWFPSLAHTDEQVEQTLEAASQALSEL